MEIKIKESLENRLNESLKSVNAILTQSPVEYSDLVWTFNVVSGNTSVLHSENTARNIYLNYDTTEPTLNLILPEVGVYEIEVMAKVKIPEDGIITSLEYHANGYIETIETPGTVLRQHMFSSNTITLNYITDNGWT